MNFHGELEGRSYVPQSVMERAREIAGQCFSSCPVVAKRVEKTGFALFEERKALRVPHFDDSQLNGEEARIFVYGNLLKNAVLGLLNGNGRG